MQTSIQTMDNSQGMNDKFILIPWIVLSIITFYGLTIPTGMQYALFFSSILLAGIPHGALDHLVEEKSRTLNSKRFSIYRFLIKYVLRMAVYGLIWYFIPSGALILFILISAWHFGETDLAAFHTKGIRFKLWQCAHGLMILSFLLLSHLEEVRQIIEVIPAIKNDQLITSLMPYRALLIIGFSVLALATMMMHLRAQQNPPSFPLPIFFLQLLAMLWLVTTLPLILAFTFYFGCWHSIHALDNIRFHLGDKEGNPMDWFSMMKKALPFTILAFLMIICVILGASYAYQFSVLLMGFFIGVALLTAPHLEVMSDMYAHLSKKRRS